VVKIKENSLAIKYPQLCEEWDYEKNGELLPEHITYGSKKKVWWKCKKGHIWDMPVYARTSLGQNCPYCSNQRVCLDNCLATVNPELAKQWDYERNKLTPYDVTSKSGKVVWWICDKNSNHRWKAKVSERSKYGCPYCTSQKVCEDNSLETHYPEICKEWNYEKNDKTPKDYTSKSSQSVWWKCSVCSHEWKQTIKNRTVNNSGCPNCDKGRKTSFPEQVIMFYLSKIFNKVKNRQNIDGVEVDIYIEDLNCAIEYDGVYYHQDKKEKDMEKNLKLKGKVDCLIRIREKGLESLSECENIFFDWRSQNGYENLLQELLAIINSKFHINYQLPQIDLKHDQLLINQNLMKQEKDNSLESVYPEIAAEWDFDKNADLLPCHVKPYSKKEVYWKCSNGHSWLSRIADRTSKNTGCPYCLGRKASSEYNLYKDNPKLCEEWAYDLNDILPTELTPKSKRKVWWRCKVNKEHVWMASVLNRNKNRTGCPHCHKENKVNKN
jgi:hypothetical protein